NLFGGCCGTSPAHIAACAEDAAGLTVQPPKRRGISAVSSARGICRVGLDEPFTIIGERINPTGKKALQAELREGKLGLVKRSSQEQEDCGAGILDVNMGLSGTDDREMILKCVALLSQSSSLPLCLDSTRPEVIESVLRVYPGRALINSVSGERERLERTLPLAARYGAMFVVLPVTDEGIPETLEERKRVVLDILQRAEALGCRREDAVVDGLVMTVSSNQEAARLTLDLIEWCTRELAVNTVCGVSNVSFGLPERAWVNAAFLMMSIGRGMSMAIANPASELMRSLILASDTLNGRDKGLRRYIRQFGGESTEKSAPSTAPTKKTPEAFVMEAVLEGDADGMEQHLLRAMQSGLDARFLVDNCLIPAIEKVGALFESGEYFLPQLIMSADAMRTGFSVLEPHLVKEENEAHAGTIVLATVKGDIHDIGKNIVALMLRNYGYEVIDLGKDVSAETIVQEAIDRRASIIGLSALMTTTMVHMKEVVALARSQCPASLRIMIGGAVVDQLYADEIGADGYAPDAMSTVRMVNAWLK
ncbi:MAG: dihydropteroate synthase, partial [Kiritimatiellae bacterium]|nr:dihydropteroate synthase [Kiritimatiellia bacterium]